MNAQVFLLFFDATLTVLAGTLVAIVYAGRKLKALGCRTLPGLFRNRFRRRAVTTVATRIMIVGLPACWPVSGTKSRPLTFRISQSAATIAAVLARENWCARLEWRMRRVQPVMGALVLLAVSIHG